MPVKTSIPYEYGTFFITFTCHKWLPLIDETNSYDQVYKWFDHLVGRGHYVSGYVIMPNHLHVLITFRKQKKSLNKEIGEAKRFIGYQIITRLKNAGKNSLLDIMSSDVSVSDRARNKHHEIWEDSFDWKHCESRAFMEQKLDYIHANPCKGKWQLAPTQEGYKHSSAYYYLTGEQVNYPVTHYLLLQDMDLTSPASPP
jgi:REP element-mobilizing transposase RayT